MNLKQYYSFRDMVFVVVFFSFLLFSFDTQAGYQTSLLPGVYIQNGGVDLDVSSYSTPIVYDWDSDGKKDLIIGQNNGGNGYVSFYRNVGTDGSPSFNGYTNIQACSNTCLLNVSGSG